ncbi:N,N-dimethylformamidase beta subunit family domain-containing protein [Chitinophaga sp. RAB17]|uniref:N,N-dimethylformamidase beta subunit family domain-containing protein n=1 Tax=Chitinophaga sp. RAB17 TaxID=3233049 RepID=UPI003F925F9F
MINGLRYRLIPYVCLIFVGLLQGCSKSGLAREVNPGVGGEIDALDSKAIQNGYPDKQSYKVGDSVSLYLSSDKSYTDNKIAIYDVNGVRQFDVPFKKIGHQEPQGEIPSQDGYQYSNPVRFEVPTLKSGIYLVANRIPIVIKDNTGSVDFTVVYPSNTENAYCESGRRSLYTKPNLKKVSFLRPIPLSIYADGFLKWVNKQRYSYNLIADVDLEDYSNIKGKILIIIGHSEYWTRTARRNFDKWVDEGNHALILSGNTMWWQISYNNKKNQVICYRGVEEPSGPDSLRNVVWTNALLKYHTNQSIGCNFDLGGYGNSGQNDGWKGFKITNPSSPLFAGLSIKKGDIINCPTVEYDGAPLESFDKEGFPVIDNKVLKFNKVELLAFDYGFRVFKTTATAMIFKKKRNSGIIVNFPTTNWCSAKSFSGSQIPKITGNAIDGLLTEKNLFSN